ncbi:hypothetical protein BaRGS_00034367 [Batillaria attramentaria]|uniref:Uncharacterized protein n=1 Tax=Batillaria attramentaria TaxID=370345 RepID=A0ABD0JHJ0_9CAEN
MPDWRAQKRIESFVIWLRTIKRGSNKFRKSLSCGIGMVPGAPCQHRHCYTDVCKVSKSLIRHDGKQKVSRSVSMQRQAATASVARIDVSDYLIRSLQLTLLMSHMGGNGNVFRTRLTALIH